MRLRKSPSLWACRGPRRSWSTLSHIPFLAQQETPVCPWLTAPQTPTAFHIVSLHLYLFIGWLAFPIRWFQILCSVKSNITRAVVTPGSISVFTSIHVPRCPSTGSPNPKEAEVLIGSSGAFLRCLYQPLQRTLITPELSKPHLIWLTPFPPLGDWVTILYNTFTVITSKFPCTDQKDSQCLL